MRIVASGQRRFAASRIRPTAKRCFRWSSSPSWSPVFTSASGRSAGWSSYPKCRRLLVKSILAVEDERFYSHHGIDPIGILRAMWVNLRSLSFQQGGSTLTQQLMKNFFLTDERTMSRKIPEAVMALIAERKYSKEMILENYLNEIYLGQRGSQGIFGVWEAAQFYFSKPLSDLTVGESALLAGLIRAPNRLSPYRSAEARDETAQRRTGQVARRPDHHRKQYDSALREKLPQRALVKVTNDAPFYVDYLRRELERKLFQ